MLSICTLFVALFGLLRSLHAKSSTGDSVLVILDNTLDRTSFSLFFDNLEGELDRITRTERLENDTLVRARL
jgi:hypothetical protein